MAEPGARSPILGSPFVEPSRHFELTAEGMIDAVAEGRRRSVHSVPAPRAKKKAQLTLAGIDPETTIENVLVNGLRDRVATWRRGGHRHVERRTRHLLEHWTREGRESRLFFCQIEAVETAIYLFEAAPALRDGFAEKLLRDAQAAHGELLHRLAFKMATGSGKTVVMAMLIAWQGLNKLASPDDRRFAKNFLVVTPGVTIRDRLRVLLPEDPDSYYRSLDLVPADLRDQLGRLHVIVTNYHAFQLRERVEAARLTREILRAPGAPSPFQETPAEMVRRVCAGLDPQGDVLVINDEAHHAYHGKPTAEKLTGDDREAAEDREEKARIWISGLEHVHRHFGRKDAAKAPAKGKGKQRVLSVFDLSATPFFLRGSGYPEGTLFPWVVSDFALVDAVEAGVVKIPRVPEPAYRELWPRIRDGLPRKRSGEGADGGDPILPEELEGALKSLYESYERLHRRWEAARVAHRAGTPPVLIVVCNDTASSRLVFRYIAGYDEPGPDGSTVLVPGKLGLFDNVKDGRWLPRPNTILVDSAELSALADGDALREVMNTVGKPGKPGEGVRCVVSVAMLTEGWDARTVTHILGVRAFTTQLLCEQVIGRGLRRTSYQADGDGMLSPEYAEVYGVPFRFIPTTDASTPLPDDEPRTRVRALPERAEKRILFPRLDGYRLQISGDDLSARFGDEARMVLAPGGEIDIHTLDHLRRKRAQEIAFSLAKRVLDRRFRDEQGNLMTWHFPRLVAIAKRWLVECVTCEDGAFEELLLWAPIGDAAADRIARAIVAADGEGYRVLPIFAPGDSVGTTDAVDFQTAQPTHLTRADRCHVSHVVADGRSWVAEVLEGMDEVDAYVRNAHVGFAIPYTIEGIERRYHPDFIARMRHATVGPLHVIVEATGQEEQDEAAKTETAERLWVPAVNNHGRHGKWGFVEVRDPRNAETTLRDALDRLARAGGG